MLKYLITRAMAFAILGIAILGSIGIADAAGNRIVPDRFDTAYVDVDALGTANAVA
jgi:hypothetical protein